ncbi:MAG TPA: hypothetical protein VI603_08365 [Saprospiraceae bacterium]|nr:hypothetical protein [Saprospiraceae bacterium]
MKKYIPIHIALVLFFLSASSVLAQTVTEALRYSVFDVLGTGRSVGTAGSMSALGGDFSVLNLNPAGTGTYRGSEFSITPAFFSNRTDASLQGSGSPAISRMHKELLLSNLGFVISSRPRDPKWKTSNFAVGITKVADYHERFEYRGSTSGSITDRYVELAQGNAADDLTGEAAIAYNTGAIYDFDEDLIYETDYLNADNASVLKRQSVESTGYNTELLFSYGANYNEQLLFGVGIGVPILSYEEDKVYREDDQDAAVPFFNALKYEEFLSTSGSGFNFKAGVIFKPAKFINIGAAYHSRTRYAMTDNFSSSLEYDYTDQNNDGPLLSESPDGSFNYNLKTPRVVSGSLGIVFAKSGFISTEIQYKNFGSARFDYSGRGNGDAFQEEEDAVNEMIREQLSEAITIRTGAELAIKKFRLRGGIELDQSQYANDDSFDPTYNAGLGFRGDKFFVDVAFQYFTLEQGLLPYVVNTVPQPLVFKDISNTRLFLTLAYRWQ